MIILTYAKVDNVEVEWEEDTSGPYQRVEVGGLPWREERRHCCTELPNNIMGTQGPRSPRSPKLYDTGGE